jgi:hypothetical protein
VKPRHFRATAYISGSQTHLAAGAARQRFAAALASPLQSLHGTNDGDLLFSTVACEFFGVITGEAIMRRLKQSLREGKAGWVILWLLGVPIPILLALFLIRGCT